MLGVIERLAARLPHGRARVCRRPQDFALSPVARHALQREQSALKTNIAAVFPHRALGRMNGAALYFEIAPGWVWIGGGVYAPDAAQLQAIRAHVAEHHQELDAIVRSRGFIRLGGLKGEQMTRVPRGFATDYPAARYLRHRQFMGVREESADFATRPDFYRQLLATFSQFVPLCRFLNEPLVARAKTDPAHFISASDVMTRSMR